MTLGILSDGKYRYLHEVPSAKDREKSAVNTVRQDELVIAEA
jgi:hypothetical protein